VAYFSGRPDPRFDPFPNSAILFKDLPIAATFSFYDDHAVLSNREETRAVEFEYERPHLSVIRSLQSGAVSVPLFHLLEQVAANTYTDGELILAIRDFRFPDPSQARIRLRPSTELLRFLIQKAQPDDALALEQESVAVQIATPVVCTDPSPNVARITSALDFREKMWRAGVSKPPPPSIEMEKTDAVPTVLKLVPLREPVRLPGAIADAFTRFPAAAKLSENKRKS
jgi:hypothetical protein